MRAKLLSITMACMICVATMNVDATGVHQVSDVDLAILSDDNLITLKFRKTDDNADYGEPDRKTPIRIPEVTKDGHTFHFITPCTGLTLQLVQGDEVCYETVITSDSLEIPSDFAGVYELQILRGNYVFFAEIEL